MPEIGETNRMDIDLTDQQIADRRAAWQRPPYKVTRGTLYRSIKNVTSDSEGCVTVAEPATTLIDQAHRLASVRG